MVVITSEEPLLYGPVELRRFLDRYVAGPTTYSWEWRCHDVSKAGSVAWLLAEGTRRCERGQPGAALLPDDLVPRVPQGPLAGETGSRTALIGTPWHAIHINRRSPHRDRRSEVGADAAFSLAR